MFGLYSVSGIRINTESRYLWFPSILARLPRIAPAGKQRSLGHRTAHNLPAQPYGPGGRSHGWSGQPHAPHSSLSRLRRAGRAVFRLHQLHPVRMGTVRVRSAGKRGSGEAEQQHPEARRFANGFTAPPPRCPAFQPSRPRRASQPERPIHRPDGEFGSQYSRIDKDGVLVDQSVRRL